MPLDERKLIILKSIIDDYILTAVPIGSRTISKRSDLGLSSATIRNEMSDLEEMGYLDQPHTSAGRIPSQKAYRLYVDALMRHTALTQDEAGKIKQHIGRRIEETEELVLRTARLLSEMTEYTSIALPHVLHDVKIRHVQLVPVSEGRALAVIVMEPGTVKNTLVSVPASVGADELERFSRMMTHALRGRTVGDSTHYLLSGMEGNLGSYRSLFEEVGEAIERESESGTYKLVMGGTTNLLRYPEYSDIAKARSMLQVLETKEALLTMLRKAQNMEFTITIGNENEIEELRDSSIVTATYKVGGAQIGSFGVIGPTRMNYSKVMAVLTYLGEGLSEVFGGLPNYSDLKAEQENEQDGQQNGQRSKQRE